MHAMPLCMLIMLFPDCKRIKSPGLRRLVIFSSAGCLHDLPLPHEDMRKKPCPESRVLLTFATASLDTDTASSVPGPEPSSDHVGHRNAIGMQFGRMPAGGWFRRFPTSTAFVVRISSSWSLRSFDGSFSIACSSGSCSQPVAMPNGSRPGAHTEKRVKRVECFRET